MATGIIPNPNKKTEQVPIHTISTITHVGPIDDSFVNSIMTIVMGLNPFPSELVINISSGGGDVRSGITAYNFLKQLPCVVHTHNLGEVSSAAILPFLAGKIRTADEVAKFVFHPATLSLNETISYPRLRELLSILDGDIHNYATIVKRELPVFCEQNDVESFLTHDTITITPPDGYRFGLLTPIPV